MVKMEELYKVKKGNNTLIFIGTTDYSYTQLDYFQRINNSIAPFINSCGYGREYLHVDDVLKKTNAPLKDLYCFELETGLSGKEVDKVIEWLNVYNVEVVELEVEVEATIPQV